MPLKLHNDINLYKLFFEHSTAHKWVRDLDGKYLLVNQSYAESLSLKKEDMVGKTNFQFMPPELAESFAKDDEAVIKNRVTSLREVSNFVQEQERTFLVLKFPLFDESNNVYAIAGAATDLTNEKLFWQNLKQKESLLASVLHNMGEGLLFFNSQGNLEFINQEASKILQPFGFSKDFKDPEAPLQFFLLKKDKNKKRLFGTSLPWAQALQGIPVREQEIEIKGLKTSLSLQISITAMPVKNHNDEMLGAVAVFRDITERNRLAEQIHKQSVELKLKNEALEQFSYFVTHDLREPLRTINSFLHLLQSELGANNTSSINTYLRFIQEAGLRVDHMISDLTKFCEVGTHISLQKVNLDLCLKKALDSLKIYLSETKAKVHCAPLPTVKGDETSLILLFQNLIVNAAKFQNATAPEIFVTLEEDAQNYIIGVKDNGIGIDARYKNTIFLPFKRAPLKNVYKGSGLGLALCKKIIDAHQSEIWVESTKGKGAHFKFKLKKEA
ncbi:MAG: PAS domain-containing protein, partial [Alphaproteobacteria bacterium]|nr:PAS domain-containing protein [Alphaproteobacteria bacterium]